VKHCLLTVACFAVCVCFLSRAALSGSFLLSNSRYCTEGTYPWHKVTWKESSTHEGVCSYVHHRFLYADGILTVEGDLHWESGDRGMEPTGGPGVHDGTAGAI